MLENNLIAVNTGLIVCCNFVVTFRKNIIFSLFFSHKMENPNLNQEQIGDNTSCLRLQKT